MQKTTKGTLNLQNEYLNKLRKEKTNVTIFTINGVKLEGSIIGFDNYIILLKVGKQKKSIYKHAISTIVY